MEQAAIHQVADAPPLKIYEPPTVSEFKTGHIIGFSGHDLIADCINLATFGVPRRSIHHVGIVAETDRGPYLFEALHAALWREGGLPPGKAAGVMAHPLDFIIENAPQAAIWHYPLRRELYDHEANRLAKFLNSKLGTPYDVLGAARSAGMFVRVLEGFLRPENVSSFFCSELCVEAWVVTGLLQTSNVSSWNPNRLCRHSVEAGICDRPRRLK